jgi:hypothetical protein
VNEPLALDGVEGALDPTAVINPADVDEMERLPEPQLVQPEHRISAVIVLDVIELERILTVAPEYTAGRL